MLPANESQSRPFFLFENMNLTHPLRPSAGLLSIYPEFSTVRLNCSLLSKKKRIKTVAVTGTQAPAHTLPCHHCHELSSSHHHTCLKTSQVIFALAPKFKKSQVGRLHLPFLVEKCHDLSHKAQRSCPSAQQLNDFRVQTSLC